MTQPTDQDRRNAELRASIAARFAAQYALIEAYATSLFGPGWEPRGHHDIVENDEADAARKEERRPVPVVSVISVRKGSETRHFTVTDGVARECGPYQEAFAALLAEKHPTKPIFKHQVNWGGYEKGYAPRTPEQLAAAREKRQQKELAKEADGSLFAEQVIAEGYQPKRRRGR